jgi:hypothetical protein
MCSFEKLGDCIHHGTIFDSETEMVQAGSQGVVFGFDIVSRSQNKSEMAIVVLNVLLSFVREFVFVETENRHHSFIKFLRKTEIRNRDVNVVNAYYLNLRFHRFYFQDVAKLFPADCIVQSRFAFCLRAVRFLAWKFANPFRVRFAGRRPRWPLTRACRASGSRRIARCAAIRSR